MQECCTACGRPIPQTIKHVTFEGRDMFYRGQIIRLTWTEIQLMQRLARWFGETVPHETLTAIWVDNASVNLLSVTLSHLRKKLRPAGLRIASVHGYGYKLCEAA